MAPVPARICTGATLEAAAPLRRVLSLSQHGATKAEANLVAAGKAELVRLARDELQGAMEPGLVTVIEGLTGRKVRRFLSGTSTFAEASVEVFVLEPELTTQ